MEPIIGANIIHLFDAPVNTKLEIAIKMVVTIISGIPVNFSMPSRFASQAVIIVPIFVCLK